MEIFVILLVICLILSFGYVAFRTHNEISALREQNKDLLNRLMANNYKEYAAVEVKKSIPRETTPAQALMNNDDVFQVN